MRTSALDYDLPPDRIAAAPAEPRDAARLLVVRREAGTLAHHHVRDLPNMGLLSPGDLLVVNRTRVLPAYLRAVRTGTGGRITGLYLHTTSDGAWVMMLEARGRLQPGETLAFDTGDTLTLTRSLGDGQWEGRTTADLHAVGDTPLPPYIRKLRDKHPLPVDDAQRYNTVYAEDAGSVAAPTAGLHFTPDLLSQIDAMGVRRAGVTLHVGVGTFLPIRSDDLAAHDMHHEHVHVPAETLCLLRETRAAGGRVVPIGTTTVRALESLPTDWQNLDGDYVTDTNLFIHPDAGFTFRFADSVMTNFHLPRSTLLAMIATLPGVGLDRLLTWYRTAIAEEYRFYSYGDAMWVA